MPREQQSQICFACNTRLFHLFASTSRFSSPLIDSRKVHLSCSYFSCRNYLSEIWAANANLALTPLSERERSLAIRVLSISLFIRRKRLGREDGKTRRKLMNLGIADRMRGLNARNGASPNGNMTAQCDNVRANVFFHPQRLSSCSRQLWCYLTSLGLPLWRWAERIFVSCSKQEGNKTAL